MSERRHFFQPVLIGAAHLGRAVVFRDPQGKHPNDLPDQPIWYNGAYPRNVYISAVTPMDENGNFQVNLSQMWERDIDPLSCERIILEVNKRLETVRGGVEINIQDVTAFYEADYEIYSIPDAPSSETDNIIGQYVAAHSKGGRSILIMHATTNKGESKIKATLPVGAAVTIPRTYTDYVVTEYGIAHLRGRSVRDRVKALASGEAGSSMPGEAPPPPPSAMAQNTEDMKNTAAISVIDGALASDEMAVTAGAPTADAITGVYASYDGIGDWDGSAVFGHYGAVLSGDNAAPFVIGGGEDMFEIDGEGYNTALILRADDRDEPNALGSATRDYKDAQEGAEGAGVYFDMPSLEMNNAYIYTSGYGRSALHTTSAVEKTVIRDSAIIAVGSEGRDSSAPGVICMYASSRPMLIESSGSTYIYNSDLISSDWGVYSLDGCYGANVYIVNDYSLNTVGGYSMYALGFNDPNTCWFYGSYAASAQYGTILCAAGRTYTGALSDAPSEALAELGESGLSDPILKNGWSYIGGRENAVTMQADMSGAEIVGILDAKHTVFDTVGVTDLRTGAPLVDTMDIYDYKNDMAYGAAHYFLSYIHGAAFGIRSENVDMTLDECEVYSSKNVAIQTVIGYDNMASNIKVPDGTEYHGSDIVIRNMALQGDILHEDYQRKMLLSLENASLTGAVVSGTCAAWNRSISDFIDAEWSDYDEALGHSKEVVYATLCPDAAYETVWGVRMSLDGGSAWTVTGDSSLNSLTVADGAQIAAPAGHTLEIYVDCEMNGADEFYDYTTGTQVASLGAGEYTGVVILVK